jgi:DNA-binding GntR family transcriptional regulator
MKTPLKQVAYDYVLEKILSGVYAPGFQLSEVSIAKEIGISPTPLREAYRQLASEGFVKHIPNSGIFVRELNDQEVVELYEAREALETFSVSKAALKMSRISIEDLQKCCQEQLAVAHQLQDSDLSTLGGDLLYRFMRADATFHMAILKAAENETIMKMVRECHIVGRLLGYRSHEHDLRQVATTVRQHFKILKAIKVHNPDMAMEWMRKHIRFSCRTALENRSRLKNQPGLEAKDQHSEALQRFVYKIETNH